MVLLIELFGGFAKAAGTERDVATQIQEDFEVLCSIALSPPANQGLAAKYAEPR